MKMLAIYYRKKNKERLQKQDPERYQNIFEDGLSLAI